MKFGWKKDPVSLKDFEFGALYKTLESRARIENEYVIPEYTPISTQLGLSSCVANSSADALEILLGVEKMEVVQLSRLYLYWLARLVAGDTGEDDGTYIRNAFLQIKRLGVCPESLWPYREDKVFVSPSIGAYMSGNSNKISGFYRITSRGAPRYEDIDLAIRANHPVVFGVPVDTPFLDFKGGKVLGPCDPSKIEGGHAMALVGTRKSNGRKQFRLRNSWGRGWSEGGYAWVDQAFMDDADDLWVPTRVDKIIE